jgi:hypothetical protein
MPRMKATPATPPTVKGPGWPSSGDQLPIQGNQQRWCCETARYRSTVCRPATWRPMTGQVNYCLPHSVCETVRCSRTIISLWANAGRTTPSLRGCATLASTKSWLAFSRFILSSIARRESYAALVDHVKEKLSMTRFAVADSQHCWRCAGQCNLTANAALTASASAQCAERGVGDPFAHHQGQ